MALELTKKKQKNTGLSHIFLFVFFSVQQAPLDPKEAATSVAVALASSNKDLAQKPAKPLTRKAVNVLSDNLKKKLKKVCSQARRVVPLKLKCHRL